MLSPKLIAIAILGIGGAASAIAAYFVLSKRKAAGPIGRIGPIERDVGGITAPGVVPLKLGAPDLYRCGC